MLYTIVRSLFRITSRFYFRSLQVNGIENIPEEGPVFFVANHPGVFLDPIVIGTVVKRPLFFLAKGILFRSKFSRWLLPQFHIIPIYRSYETPDQAGKNKEIFALCHRHLEKNGCILAFPEGISLTERRIKKIQTETSRICLGAEAENDFKLNVKIVVICLNFSDPHSFQRDLFIKIDKPVHVCDYKDEYNQDAFRAAHALTDEIRRRLESQVVAIKDAASDEVVTQIELIYKSQLLEDLGHSPKKMQNDFKTTKAISESVHYFFGKRSSAC